MSRNDHDVQPTMLILTRSIYAKRSNDAFYTGNIETKLPDGSYLVKFTDGASESVEERDIMWLGFWGLPPWTWPRNPIVQCAGPANMDFLTTLVQNENTKEPIPNSASFQSPSREANVDKNSRENDFLGLGIKSDVSTRNEMTNTEELNLVKETSAHILPRQFSQPENQTRVSVLRMYCSGYLKQEPTKNESERHSTEHDVESPVFKRSPHSGTPHREERKCFTFDPDCTALKIKNDLNVRKRRTSTPEHEECSSHEKYQKLEDIENRLRNTSPAQKHHPAHLSHFLSSHCPNYSHPFGISMYDAPSPPIPASFRLHTRVRRRSENKKCRKVYGIENRDIWCTQCKWKKACTRFTSSDKDDGSGFMYITDYEGLPYPV